MKAYHIYLLRHGQTKANSEGRYVGRLDPSLSPEGEEELLRLADKYTYPGAARFYSSPRRRCLESLGILYPGAKPRVVEGLAECDFGEYEGRTLSELKDDPKYRKWASGEISAAPGGEDSKAFQLRCCSAFEEIADELMRSGEQTAVVMAHGGTIMSILGAYAFPRQPMYEWMTGNGMGFEVVITPQLFLNGKAIEVAGAVPLKVGEGFAANGDDAESDEYDD